MKLDTKEFFKLSFLYTAVAALPPLLNLIIRPLMEGDGKLLPDDFSRIEITETIITLVLVIASFATSSSISRFYFDHNEDKKRLNVLVSGIFSSILFRGAVILLFAFAARNYIGQLFSQPELQDFPRYGFAAIIAGINRSVNFTAFALYRNEKKVRKYLILSFVLGVLRAGFQLIGVLYYEMSFVGYVYGTCIGSSIVTVTILAYTFKKSGFHYNFKMMKPVNQYAFPLFEYSLIVWGLSFADRFFLESSPAILGIYSQAVLLGRGIDIILQGLQGVSQPEMFRLLKLGIKENMEDIKKLSHLLMAQSQIIIAAAILPAMLYCSIFKTDLKLAAGFVTVIMVSYILRTQYLVFSLPVYYEKKTKSLLYLNLVVLAVNLVLLYFLVPWIKAYGAIAALFASLFLQVIGIYFVQDRIIKITWNLTKLLFVPGALVIFTIFLEAIKLQTGMNAFTGGIIITALIAGSQVFLYKKEIAGLIKGRGKMF
jgi:O-antigen/teichoic acid export membrane protein